MPEEQIVNCVKDCWYSKKGIYFVRGDEASIDPLDPVAMYFDGFRPGTEVYHKIAANKKKGIKRQETTRIVPGKVEEAERAKEPQKVPVQGTGLGVDLKPKIQTPGTLEAEANPDERIPCPWADCDKDYAGKPYLQAHITKRHGGLWPKVD